MAKSLQGKRTTTLGATECVNLLMERLKALRVNSTVAEMIKQVKDCATKNGMKMPEDDESRVSRSPTHYRSYTETEALPLVT